MLRDIALNESFKNTVLSPCYHRQLWQLLHFSFPGPRPTQLLCWSRNAGAYRLKASKKVPRVAALGVSYIRLRGCVNMPTAPGSSNKISVGLPTGRTGIDWGTSAHRNGNWGSNSAGFRPQVVLRRSAKSGRRLTSIFNWVVCNIFAKISPTPCFL